MRSIHPTAGPNFFRKSKNVAMLAIFLWISLAAPAGAFDFSVWDELLKKYVAPTTISGVRVNGVKYGRLKSDPKFPQLVAQLKSAQPDALKSREAKLAFWINAYNIMAVKMILDHYPLKSIKDAGSIFSPVWKKPVGVVGGKERTLHEIEHEILRKMDEPRIHVAIVCASVSCPDLKKESYTPDRLNEQLDDQMKSFLQNPGKGLEVDSDGKIYLSAIFDWFEEDFKSKGGVLPFLKNHAPTGYKKSLANPKSNVSYLNYDWNLNEI